MGQWYQRSVRWGMYNKDGPEEVCGAPLSKGTFNRPYSCYKGGFRTEQEYMALSQLAPILNMSRWGGDREANWNNYMAGRVLGSECVVSMQAIRWHPVSRYQE